MKLDRTRHLLFVEGDDDLFVLANLVEAHVPGVVLDRAFVSRRSVDNAIELPWRTRSTSALGWSSTRMAIPHGAAITFSGSWSEKGSWLRQV